MKSFYHHLSSTHEFGEKIESVKKPILRSSSIFPVIKNNHFSSRILFLGYWLIKRNIPEVSLLITLREKNGKILDRQLKTINSVQSFTIDLDSLLEELDYTENFLGSIETEFHTTRDMVFPYPALVLEYFNKNFDTYVHTIGRVYNDFEDLTENQEFKVSETGFDIYADDDLSSFFAFVNGPISNDNGLIEYEITNFESKKFSGSFNLGQITPFETKFIELKNYIPSLSKYLGNHSGSISLKHNFEGFYPRFLVGNFQNSFPSVSFTHSYYDCTTCNSDSDFWNRIDDNYHDSSIYIPLFLDKNKYTDLVIYPNFSPSDFDLQIELYDKHGQKHFENTSLINVKSSDSKLTKIPFKKLIKDYDLDDDLLTSAHIISKFKNKKIPTRLKFGLNVGISGFNSKLPCNICFNSRLGNPAIENKPGSFHWSPVFPYLDSTVTIANFSPRKEYSQSANLIFNFYRKQDSSFISRKHNLFPNEEYRILLDDELKSFFQEDVGWITIKSDNPYVQGYYFNFYSSGAVAGDHLF
jgi:hypothetical protein